MIISGQKPFQFIYREDLRSLPKAAISHESNLHGAFAVDKEIHIMATMVKLINEIK